MQFQLLLQFIIPLTFLAIWALTSLLNRDAQPMPPRPGAGRAPGGGPPRPGGGGFSPSARGEALAAGRATGPGRPIVERTAPPRWSSPPASASGRPGGGPARSDDGITILESQTRPTGGSNSSFSPSSAATSARGARGLGAGLRRAVSRVRSTPAAPSKPVERERSRSLTGLSGESLGQKQGKPLSITPLTSQFVPIASPLSSASHSMIAETSTGRPAQPTMTSNDIRALIATPGKLREIALLGELLQPPLALRTTRRLH